MSQDSNSPDPPPLTEEDYHRFFFYDWKWILAGFIVIFSIVQGTLIGFGNWMRSNSNLKVQEARATLKKVSELPDTATPRTLKIEEVAADFRARSEWILRELHRDSFPRQLNAQLKDRFLQESPMYQLPADWKSMLSPDLKQWANRRRQQRRDEIRQFLSRLKTQLTAVQNDLENLPSRVDAGASKTNFGGARKRFQTARKNLRRHIRQVFTEINQTQITAPRIPRHLFRELLDLPDALTRVALHLNRISGLTARPSALLHAKKVLEDALRIDPENPRAHFLLGKVYARMGLHVLAGEQFGRALRSDPQFEGRDEILTRLRERLDNQPRSARRHYDLAFALYEIGKFKEARQHLQTVLSLERGQQSFVKVLARKRLSYIRHGEPPYHVPVNF